MEEYNADNLDTIVSFLYKEQSQNLSDCYGYFAVDMGKIPCAKDIRERKSSFKFHIRKEYEKHGFDCFNKFEKSGIQLKVLQKLEKNVKNAEDIYEKISCIFNENETQEVLDILAPLLQSEKESKIKKSKNVSTSKIMD